MFLAHLIAIAILLFIAVIDWQRHEIWHAVTLPSIGLSLLGTHWLPARFLANGVLGGIAGFLLFFAIWALAKRAYGTGALGFGDVLLAALLGALGGVVNGLFWLAAGMLLAGAHAGWLRYRQRREPMAYGTFLALAGVLGLLL